MSAPPCTARKRRCGDLVNERCEIILPREDRYPAEGSQDASSGRRGIRRPAPDCGAAMSAGSATALRADAGRRLSPIHARSRADTPRRPLSRITRPYARGRTEPPGPGFHAPRRRPVATRAPRPHQFCSRDTQDRRVSPGFVERQHSQPALLLVVPSTRIAVTAEASPLHREAVATAGCDAGPSGRGAASSLSSPGASPPRY